MNRWVVTGLIVTFLVVIGFLVAAAVFEPFRIASRDIAIIVLAVFQIISTIILIAILLAVWFAIRATRSTVNTQLIPQVNRLTQRVDDLVNVAQDAAGNVRDTTAATSKTTVYVAERVVSPIIRISSLLSGVRAGAQALARSPQPGSDQAGEGI